VLETFLCQESCEFACGGNWYLSAAVSGESLERQKEAEDVEEKEDFLNDRLFPPHFIRMIFRIVY